MNSHHMQATVKTIVFKVLFFKATRQDFLHFSNKHLLAGIIGTLLAGMGRYWDNPKADLLQYLGVGSFIYIFCMAVFIYIIVWPFRLPQWKYKTVLTFVSLTSFPAILYAIPVERFTSIATAATVNAWFLGIVALWRLCLLWYFLKIFCGFAHWQVAATALLPVCIIICILTALNLEKVVFDIMSGIRDNTANRGAYDVLLFLTSISILLVLPLFVAYLIAVVVHSKRK